MMTGKKYIQLAQSLLQNNDDDKDLIEAEIRAALSRYYYGLLHCAIDKLIYIDKVEFESLKDNLTNPPQKEYKYSIHGSVISSIKSKNSIAGTNLDIARELRVFSDYHFDKLILNFPLKVKEKIFSSKDEILTFLNDVEKEINKLKDKKDISLRADVRGLDSLLENFHKQKNKIN